MPEAIITVSTLLLIFSAAILGGLTAMRLGLPLMIGYVFAGIAVGHLFPAFIEHGFLTSVADTGVTLLLFTVGVEFPFHRLKKTIGIVMPAALIQILLVAVAVSLIGSLAGFRPAFAVLTGIIVALSSTAIIVKYLGDRGELDSLSGELAASWMVVQDLSVIPIMVFLPVLTGAFLLTDPAATFTIATLSLAKTVAVLGSVFLLGRWGVPKALNLIAGLKNREIFVLSTVGLIFLCALATYAAGLSAPLGAFLAGLIVSETSQNHAIFSEIRPLRDLFAVVFFTSLGMLLPGTFVLSYLPVILMLTVLILSVKSGVQFVSGRIAGLHRRVAFLLALLLLPVSEFGFIIAREGAQAGSVSGMEYNLLVSVVLMSAILSAPLPAYSGLLYRRFNRLLSSVPQLFNASEPDIGDDGLPLKDHVVICGYGRVGRYIGRALAFCSIPFAVIDFNHATVKAVRQAGFTAVYGDPSDPRILDFAQVDLAKVLVVAIPDLHTQEMVIKNALQLNKRIRIYCRTHFEEDQQLLKELGVHTVIQPEFEAALTLTGKLLSDFGVGRTESEKKMTRLKIEHGMG
ncbi:hypothetical protein A2Z33_01280 [Candidatus Gottesmanbacteria bacterium RBG_16_52_11]|uniref:RCK N-terminal domain-containing protein n=1 Tax=Candidatus Gottesmanbacteria bacterium RBG_16_52_11 TaxID=1798374 RepID=A0A1F5YP13_9BACT|nr:MAG: hypothetical protein A2Z33_01280 [Candidatus Gottesmanbacteria bacterium RBG_16_52_11]